MMNVTIFIKHYPCSKVLLTDFTFLIFLLKQQIFDDLKGVFLIIFVLNFFLTI